MQPEEKLKQLEGEYQAAVGRIQELQERAAKLNAELNEEHEALKRNLHRIEGAITVCKELVAGRGPSLVQVVAG